MGAVSERAETRPECFSLDSRQAGSTLLLSLGGEFDWAATGRVEGALEDATDLPLDQVVFDLSDLTFIDLPALKVILKTQERALANGFQVRVVRPRGLANRIFTLTRAAETLEMVDHI
jgi:anti-anti-sigma factor